MWSGMTVAVPPSPVGGHARSPHHRPFGFAQGDMGVHRVTCRSPIGVGEFDGCGAGSRPAPGLKDGGGLRRSLKTDLERRGSAVVSPWVPAFATEVVGSGPRIGVRG